VGAPSGRERIGLARERTHRTSEREQGHQPYRGYRPESGWQLTSVSMVSLFPTGAANAKLAL
jgi:hypothetical protein